MAVLPWTVAILLFLVLVGSVVLVGLGLTADPPPGPQVADSAVQSEPPAPAPEPTPEPPAAEPPASAQTPPEVNPPEEPSPPASSSSVPPSAAAENPPGEAPPETQTADATPPPAPARDPDTKPAPEAEPATTEVASVPPTPPPSAAPVRRAPDALPPAPDPTLVEPSPQGPLPRIGPTGREPWRAYARPSNVGDERPKVAIILSGLGLSSAATEAAIQGLPSEVTLAFQPFADNIQQWIRLSRAAGHEVLLNLPMEPVDFPANDPGPRALFVSLSPEENQDRLRWALSRVSGYVGVVNHMGSRFTVSREAMQPILAELKARGLLFVDARSAARSVATVLASEMQVPRAINDRFLDNREVSRLTIDARLAEVEAIARETGVSIAIGQAFPVTIERIREWSDTLSGKGISLVPISAVVDRQPDR
ncbi:MAG: divergent polysaccharide deacetylase family protein [Alphaproteobacteria bacterium]|nr:divergent polysaccharide deacetylase family protein [Alphaproteobacteria bacterium]